MTLLLAMLPVYLLGNVHCLGMCGPIVAFLGKHRYRYAYFAGRLFSYSLAGLAAGEMGAVFHIWLKDYNLSAYVSIGFGLLMIWAGGIVATGRAIPGHRRLGQALAGVNRSLSILLLKDTPLTTSLFGFASILLPCGQTLLVFSACAMAQSAAVGLLNGFAFGLLTTPSLWLAMRASRAVGGWRVSGDRLLGACAVLVGSLGVLRGGAELEWLSHFVLSDKLHLVLY